MAKQSLLPLTQGEVLRILVLRSERNAKELAPKLGLEDATYLSKLYRKKMIPDYVKQSACALFGYSEDVFDMKTVKDVFDRIDSMESSINLLKKENDHLQTKVALLNARLEDCERKKGILEAKTN